MGDNMKTILITGSSTGIGRATAEFFADKGWNVAATDAKFMLFMKKIIGSRRVMSIVRKVFDI